MVLQRKIKLVAADFISERPKSVPNIITYGVHHFINTIKAAHLQLMGVAWEFVKRKLRIYLLKLIYQFQAIIQFSFS